MENLTQEQQTKVFEFLNSLKTEVCITDYVNIEDIDISDSYQSIFDSIEDNSGFNIDIIYYSKAIEYLQNNDPSLRESLEIAADFGYEVKSLNSEVLASLLASQNARSEFADLENEITSFFEELQEEIENSEEEEEETEE